MASFTRARGQMVLRRRLAAQPSEPVLVAASQAVGASSWEASVSVPKPAVTAAGDLLVAICASRNNRSWSDPHGFTELADQGANPCLRVAWKIAGSSEPASYNFVPSGNSALAAQVLCIRDGAIDATGAVATLAGDGNLSLPQVTAQGGLLLAFAATGEASAGIIGIPAGMSAVSAQVDIGAVQLRSFVQSLTPGVTGSRSCPVSNAAAGVSAGLLLAIKGS